MLAVHTIEMSSRGYYDTNIVVEFESAEPSDRQLLFYMYKHPEQFSKFLFEYGSVFIRDCEGLQREALTKEKEQLKKRLKEINSKLEG